MSSRKGPGRWGFLLAAIGLYAIWALATYVLEGRNLTLLKPEAAGARLAYALIANVLIGVVGAGLVLRTAVRQAGVDSQRLGFRSRGRTALSIALGLGLGSAGFMLQQPTTLAPLVIVNAFTQVWVVSVAEVLVCWAALGKAVEMTNVAASWWPRMLAAWLVSAVAFGIYHFAHSPPFNSSAMVGLLVAVGLVTGAFFLAGGELYGTIVLHNFMALKGVTDALTEGGRLEHFSTPQWPLIFTALFATAVLAATDVFTRRQSASGVSESA